MTVSLLSPGARLLCAAAALCTTSALAALLLASWHHKADPVWLVATPELLAEVAACEAEGTRAERVRCKRSLVAARVPNEGRGIPLASR